MKTVWHWKNLAKCFGGVVSVGMVLNEIISPIGLNMEEQVAIGSITGVVWMIWAMEKWPCYSIEFDI